MAPGVLPMPFTGRILVFFGQPGAAEPRFGPNWFNPEPIWSILVSRMTETDVIPIDGETVQVFPRQRTAPPVGTWMVQAVADCGLARSVGNGAGNGMSMAVKWNTSMDAPELVIDKLIAEPTFTKSDRVEAFSIQSRRLTSFAMRPVMLNCAIIYPEGWSPTKSWPVLYEIPGFGGRHYGTRRGGNAIDKVPIVRVVLDADCPGGHHVFADSANNGPYGEALIKELIPAVERKVNGPKSASGRLLKGHSSGGWSSLWLQVRYPDMFGGVWSTSPDPVDFHDFQRINLYEHENMFFDPQGKLRPIARQGEEPVVWYRDFSDMEVPLGRGEQLGSFEAAFSPRGQDGQPERLWNRASGQINHRVAAAWKPYDICDRLERNWKQLAPKLKGKLHVYTGSLDSFYLEGAVGRLQTRLAKLGSDAKVEVIPGKDHGSVMDTKMLQRIADEIGSAVRSAGF